MKHHRYSLAALIPAALVLTVGCSDVPTTAPESSLEAPAVGFSHGGGHEVVVSISGAGHFSTIDGTFRRFTINATRKADGSVEGRWMIQRRPQGLKTQGDVTCFSIIGDQAWWGGVITAAGEPTWIGTDAAGTLKDNGEGRNDPADQVSLAFVAAPAGFGQANCDTQQNSPPLNDITAGNVQVNG